MRKLGAFIFVSLDGYYADAHGDMRFAHQAPGDQEWNDFSTQNASGGSALLFGRVTYDMMASFWPTLAAMQQMPAVAKGMNASEKFVASRSVTTPTWANTTALTGDLIAKMRSLKAQDGKPITTLGSGSIVSQLLEARLLDELQLVIVPVILGRGKSLLVDVKATLPLKLNHSRTFNNGCVVLGYRF